MNSISFHETAFAQLFPDEVVPIFKLVEGRVSVNGNICLPIVVSSYYDRTSPLIICDGLGSRIGEILFQLNKTVKPAELSILEFTLYASDNYGQAVLRAPYTFKSDYVLISEANIANYVSALKATSAVWGGYFHPEDLPASSFTYQHKGSVITALPGIILDKDIYKENLELAIREQNPFNRFLKLYHLLELRFDLHTAEKISRLLGQGGRDREISILLKEYNREDVERLKSLLKESLDPDVIAPYMDVIKHYKAKAKTIFYEYGKDSNPLKSFTELEKILDGGGFTRLNFEAIIKNRRFEDVIPVLVSYWIYRIRSCVAHNKLGEYVMTSADEEFVVEFGEGLLKAAVIQSFKA